jgi:uncharacterized SAM-binding protein YcdF (DUF218 family)
MKDFLRLRRWSLIILAVVFLGVIGLVLGTNPLLRSLGSYLVTTQPLEKAEAILLLSGGPATRAREAARLFHEGYAPEIVFVTANDIEFYKELRQEGILIQREYEVNALVLCHERVPVKAMTILDLEASSTFLELRALALYIQQRKMGTVILVTSKAHTTRSLKLMRYNLPTVKFVSHPTRFDDFRIDGWWQNRHHVLFVITEYIKLVNFWLWGDYWQAGQDVPPVPALPRDAVVRIVNRMMTKPPCLEVPRGKVVGERSTIPLDTRV